MPSSFLNIELRCEPAKGSSIGEVTKDAIRLAANEWRDTEFTFNGKTYRVALDDLRAAVKPVVPPITTSITA